MKKVSKLANKKITNETKKSNSYELSDDIVSSIVGGNTPTYATPIKEKPAI